MIGGPNFALPAQYNTAHTPVLGSKYIRLTNGPEESLLSPGNTPGPSLYSLTTAYQPPSHRAIHRRQGAVRAYTQSELKKGSKDSINPLTGQRNIVMPHLANKFQVNQRLTPLGLHASTMSPHMSSKIHSGNVEVAIDDVDREAERIQSSQAESLDLLVGSNRLPMGRGQTALAFTRNPSHFQPHSTFENTRSASPPSSFFKARNASTIEYLVDNKTGLRVPLKQPNRIDQKREHQQRIERQKTIFDGSSLAKNNFSIDIKNDDEKNLPKLSHLDIDKGHIRRRYDYKVEDIGSLERRRKTAQTATAGRDRDAQTIQAVKTDREQKAEGALRSPYGKVIVNKRARMCTEERKKTNEGRFNKSFLPGTPTIHDSEIRDLIKRYPLDPMKEEEGAERVESDPKQSRHHFNQVYADRYKSVQAMDRDERNKQISKDIEMLASHATNSSNQTKQIFKDHINKMVTEDFRVAEMSKITEILREIEFAEPETLYGMFDYR